MKNENKNLLIALILSIGVLVGVDYFLPSEKTPSTPAAAVSIPEQAVQTLPMDVKKVVLQTEQEPTPVVSIQSEKVSGSIRLKGARIDQLTLLKYKQTTALDSPDVLLLNDTYFADFSILSNSGIDVPDEQTLWQASADTLSPNQPLTLTWTNKEGFVFNRTILLDENYMFTVTDSILNPTDKKVTIYFDGALNRVNPPAVGRSTVHQGFVGVLDGSLKEESYSNVEDDKKISYTTQGGWLGITDKYWLAAFAFNQNISDVKGIFSYQKIEDKNVFQARFVMPGIVIGPNEKAQNVTYFFAGPKELNIINGYQETLGILKFDRAIDFGWYYFLTKPFLYILGWLNHLVGNMGIAILIFATLLRILLLPIAGKSFESMAKMKKLQPRIKTLQERFPNDKMRQNQEMMALYKKENVNPAAGCLPMFIQIPIFFSLYKVLSVSIEMRQAPFFGWIHDLSAPDPTSVFTLFGLAPWPIPAVFNIGVWPVLMGLTMYLQQKMNPSVGDNKNGQMTFIKWMPVIFTFMMGHFASGLIIYWTWSNVLSIAQQRYVMRKYGVD